ncbi:tyrosine lyase ThiH [Alkalithermobacter thermoalcaliphilus JW-YL-7 = DSM 7308]|uniref:Thiazole biosynthesis protein ThiH n=1 Tax=Alkalithermobacter thermoalcaliphilus JW-YL-7 = DSM 7308 TaxID=1121328 RepID=A0A150FNX8_CLOPD|nr:thiazole biosynthesis protein ThiH [[Clostridium] paradoxum JW-YL-7 = DSM 7308]SHK55737.1 tyrosine lyase ThiH [[Clostridium] paradoxum JW-YL-7 = DSM 7308]
MGFYDKYSLYKNFNFENFYINVKDSDIENVLRKDKLNEIDLLTLLSPSAEKYLEKIATKANEISVKQFGKTILLYTPIYISNFCRNVCSYCSFSLRNKIDRKQLTLDEIKEEAKAIYENGIRHILILTGEDKIKTHISYLKDCIRVLKQYFDSISIEIYALDEKEYRELINEGVDGLTIYQEVYNEQMYSKVHISGDKKNYKYRLDAPERACRQNIRFVNLGVLLGLYDWRSEVFFMGLHGKYLQNKYSHVEISFSFPRIRPFIGSNFKPYKVTDKNLVQSILALRLYIPRAGINISTRENALFRDKIIPLGVTKMSAGVSTQVGGYSLDNKGVSQFDICDTRSVEQVKKAIISAGYQPVFKDWMII